MITKKVIGNVFDVFWGDGWDNWARIENRRGFVKPIAGQEIPKIVFQMLIREFSHHD